jgi:hypothetical protein
MTEVDVAIKTPEQTPAAVVATPIHTRLVYTNPSPEQAALIEKVRVALSIAMNTLYRDVPENDYRKAAILQLEVTSMLANKAIVHGGD